MTAAPVKTEFPDSSQSPWTNPDTGLTYEWNGWGWDLLIEEIPDTDKEPPSGSAFTFTFAACLSSDFDSKDGQILLSLSGGLQDDFSVPLQTLQAFEWTEKDINGFATPEWRDDWDVHIYAEDVSAGERGGVTLGWRSASSSGRKTVGICEDNVNSSLTILEEGALVQLVFTPKGVEPEGRLSPLRYRYKAIGYEDFTGRDGTIGIGLGAEDGSDGLGPGVLVALSAIEYPEADLAGNVAPGFGNQHEVFICAADKDTGKEGTYRVLMKEGGQRGYRKGFVEAEWYTDFNSPKIQLGSDIELIFIPVAKAALEDNRVQINEGVPDEPWEQGDLYFDATEDELTLYLYTGDDWVPAAPPVSLDGIESDITSLQEVASDVKKQLAYHTVEAQKADLKILDLEEGVADLTKKVDAIEVPEVEDLASLKKRISDLESKLSSYEKYEKAPAVVAWKWKGKSGETYSKDMRWDNSKFLYISHVPAVGDCIKLDHKKWNEGQAHNINGGLLSFWVYRNNKWYQTAIFHICKYRLNYGGWFQFEYTWWTGQEPDADELTYVSMSGMF